MKDRLQKFAQLVDSGSFTRAAQQLQISQPALTIAINKLERELHAPLLIRANRRLELTAAGQATYAASVDHRTISDNLLVGLAELANARSSVTVGMVDGIAAALCAATQPLERLETAADVSIVVNNSRYLRGAVKNRSLDIAFVVDDGSRADPVFDTRTIGAEPFAMVCRSDQQGLAQAGLTQGNLQNFISYDQSSATYHIVDQALKSQGIKPQPRFYSTSPDIILQMVLLGKGVAALPYQLIHSHLQSGSLIDLKAGGTLLAVERPIVQLKLRGRKLPTVLEIFSDQAKLAVASVWQDQDYIGYNNVYRRQTLT